jgi:hypothetical protein
VGQKKAIARMIKRRFDGQRYGMIGFNDGVVLMRRGVKSNPQVLSEWKTYQKDLSP